MILLLLLLSEKLPIIYIIYPILVTLDKFPSLPLSQITSSWLTSLPTKQRMHSHQTNLHISNNLSPSNDIQTGPLQQ